MATHLFQLAQNHFSSLAFFWVLNFRGHFEALNDVFWNRNSLHHIQTEGVFPFRYCTSQWYFSNGLLSTPNKDHMQKLCPREDDIPTYYFRVHKIVGFSSSRVMFRVSLYELCYKGLWTLCNAHLWMSIADTSLLRDKLPPFKQVFCIYAILELLLFCI